MKKFLIKVLSCFIIFSTTFLPGCDKTTNISTPNTSTPISTPPTDTDNTSAQSKKIALDKSFHNERFNFEIKYPSVWESFEESDNTSICGDHCPDQGIYIYFDKNKEDNFIYIYGQFSSIALDEPSMTVSEFITDEGVKGKMYSCVFNKNINKHVIINDYHGYHGIVVRSQQDLYEQNEETILKIMKSLKIKPVKKEM